MLLILEHDALEMTDDDIREMTDRFTKNPITVLHHKPTGVMFSAFDLVGYLDYYERR